MTQVAESRQASAGPTAPGGSESVGHWINGARSAGTSGRSGPIFNPATGSIARQVDFASVADVDRAVAAAAAAFPAWRALSLSKRTEILFRIRNLVDTHRGEIAAHLTAEHGKVPADALGEIAREYKIRNVRTLEGRWPPADPRDARAAQADVVLIAHVGYDIAAIGPFVDALEAAARRTCLAVLMDRVPASAADPFWPPVHGEARESLPALPEFLELLRARGRPVRVRIVPNEGRRFDSRASLAGFVRRQLWIDPVGAKEARFQAALDTLAVDENGGWTIDGRGPAEIGIVTWSP